LADETLADRILHHEALTKQIIGPGSRAEQRAGLATFFEQVAKREG
jgi:hypothetical protein